jgi:hypothetical protein
MAGRKNKNARAAGIVGLSAKERAEWVLSHAQDGVDSAAPGSVAYVQSLRAVMKAGQELDLLKAAERGTITAADMTPEEWNQRVRDDAQAATDEDLELYVHEWLTRHGYRLVVEGGQLRLAVAS